MDYEEWAESVPREITNDSLWRIEAYRLAMFAADLGWHDVSRLMRDKRTIGLADQLYRALGSVGANIEEGYSRHTGKDRARFYEYSLGSAREARGWYHRGRHVLGTPATDHRVRLQTQIVRLLLTIIPDQRRHNYQVREGDNSDSCIYEDDGSRGPDDLDCSASDLLTNVPLPRTVDGA